MRPSLNNFFFTVSFSPALHVVVGSNVSGFLAESVFYRVPPSESSLSDVASELEERRRPPHLGKKDAFWLAQVKYYFFMHLWCTFCFELTNLACLIMSYISTIFWLCLSCMIKLPEIDDDDVVAQVTSNCNLPTSFPILIKFFFKVFVQP